MSCSFKVSLYPNCVHQHCELDWSVRKAIELFHQTGLTGEFVTGVASAAAADRQVQLWVQWPYSGCCPWITEIIVRRMKNENEKHEKEEQLLSMNQDFWIDSIWYFHSPLPTKVCKNKVNVRKNTVECFCGSLQRKHTD